MSRGELLALVVLLLVVLGEAQVWARPSQPIRAAEVEVDVPETLGVLRVEMSFPPPTLDVLAIRRTGTSTTVESIIEKPGRSRCRGVLELD